MTLPYSYDIINFILLTYYAFSTDTTIDWRQVTSMMVTMDRTLKSIGTYVLLCHQCRMVELLLRDSVRLRYQDIGKLIKIAPF